MAAPADDELLPRLERVGLRDLTDAEWVSQDAGGIGRGGEGQSLS